MPMPHKGEREYVPTRLPLPDAKKLRAYAELIGSSRGDVIAEAVHIFLQTVDLEKIQGQEALPIAQAS